MTRPLFWRYRLWHGGFCAVWPARRRSPRAVGRAQAQLFPRPARSSRTMPMGRHVWSLPARTSAAAAAVTGSTLPMPSSCASRPRSSPSSLCGSASSPRPLCYLASEVRPLTNTAITLACTRLPLGGWATVPHAAHDRAGGGLSDPGSAAAPAARRTGAPRGQFTWRGRGGTAFVGERHQGWGLHLSHEPGRFFPGEHGRRRTATRRCACGPGATRQRTCVGPILRRGVVHRAGSISVAQIVGVESNSTAAGDAVHNVAAAGVPGHIIDQDVAAALRTPELAGQTWDTIILDPPRTGVDAPALAALSTRLAPHAFSTSRASPPRWRVTSASWPPTAIASNGHSHTTCFLKPAT